MAMKPKYHLHWFIAFYMMALFCGCGSHDEDIVFERLSDIVPLKVVITDFAEIDSGGVKATYRIKGSALLTSSMNAVDVEFKENSVVINNLPVPSVDDNSIKFEDGQVELLDAQRGLFTSVNKAVKVHNELYSNAHKAIKAAASDPKVVEEAQKFMKQTIEGFYKGFDKTVTIRWKASTRD